MKTTGKTSQRQLLYSFLAPFSIMLVAFLLAGIAPFGNRNLMAMDAYNQYFPMLRQLLKNKSDWSFAGGLGFNQVSQSAYYTNSPLWLLLYLAPPKALIEAIHFIVLLRFALAGLSFAFFLLRTYPHRSSFLFVFATAYALSAYTLAFINQFMWLDIIILLPLLAAALQHLWHKEKFLPFCLVLAYALYTNFYLAYSLCGFAVLWSLYLLFAKKYPAARRLAYLARFFATALLAAGLAACVLLPTYLSLQNTLSADLTFKGQLKLYHPLQDYLLQFLPFRKISLAYEVANLYCGLAALALAFLYLLNKARTLRQRIIFLCFLVGSYFSFNLNLLDYIWHGCHYPNQLPARQSYLFIFVLLLFAYQAFQEKFYLAKPRPKRTPSRIRAYQPGPLIALLLLVEISLNCFFTVTVYTWKANQQQYIKYDTDMQYLTQHYLPQANQFYRIEFLEPGHNQGLRYGYNGLGYYSSLMSGQAYQFFKELGMDVYAKNVSTNYVPEPLLNDIFAVRYLIQDKDDPVDISQLDLIEVVELDKLVLYENPSYYELGFFLPGQNFSLSGAGQLRQELGKQIDKVSFWQLEEFSPDRIKARIKTEASGQLLTSIGSEKGWTVSINGLEAEIQTAFDYLLAVSLPAGEHLLEFTYQTPGQKPGWLLTLASIIYLSLWLWLAKQNRLGHDLASQ